MKSRNSDPKEIKELHKLAKQGDVGAQFRLGWVYANGRGVAQNDQEAAYWYKQVVDNDPTNAVATFSLGWMYANGRGVVKDLDKAVELYGQAAPQGDVLAQFHLGLMYLDGEGVTQNEAVALEWFRKAAAQGDQSAKAQVKRIEKNLAEQKQTFSDKLGEKTKEEAKKPAGQRKAMLHSMDWMQKNAQGDNVFHNAAAYEKRPEAFKTLLDMVPKSKKGILLKQTNLRGNTPLHLLAYQGLVNLIENTITILGEEAQPILKCAYNNRGYLPIHEAAESGELGAIKALIEAGSDANALTKNGLTVAQCAERNGHAWLAKELNKSFTTPFSSPTANSPQISLSHSASSFPRKLEEDCIDDQGIGRINLVIPYEKLLRTGPLGAGSFSTVYRGRYQGRDVAIKKLFDKPLKGALIDEMRREAGIMLQLPHPNIVRLYGIVLEPECCIVLEFMQNGSLYMLLQSDKPLSWKLRYEIAWDIANGLAFLHENEIIHRDLKSLNVLLDRANQAKISDFGLSRITSFNNNDSEQRMQEESTKAKSNRIGRAGTVPWIAPELFHQGQDYTAACDVYSFGMVIWELMARREPYAYIAAVELLERWVQEGKREEIPEEAPLVLRELAISCWAGDPTKRPTMEVVLKILAETPVEDDTAISSPYSLLSLEEESSYLRSKDSSVSDIAGSKEASSYYKSSEDGYIGLSSENAPVIDSPSKPNGALPGLDAEGMKKSTARGTCGFFPSIAREKCGLRSELAVPVAEMASSKPNQIADARKSEFKGNTTLGEPEFLASPVERRHGLSQSLDIIRKKQEYPKNIPTNYITSSFSSQEYSVKEEAIAQEAYRTLNPEHLSFRKGEQLIVLDKKTPKWWLCELNGKQGLVPSRHLSIITPIAQSGSSRYIMGSGYN